MNNGYCEATEVTYANWRAHLECHFMSGLIAKKSPSADVVKHDRALAVLDCALAIVRSQLELPLPEAFLLRKEIKLSTLRAEIALRGVEVGPCAGALA